MPTHKKVRLFLVDDDQVILTIHKLLVKKSNITSDPELYLNGKSAIKAIRSNKDSEALFIVLLDINMPIMNGWEFLDSVNEENVVGEIHVAMVTSSLSIKDRNKADSYPQVFEYIKKPLTDEVLNQVICDSKVSQYF